MIKLANSSQIAIYAGQFAYKAKAIRLVKSKKIEFRIYGRSNATINAIAVYVQGITGYSPYNKCRDEKIMRGRRLFYFACRMIVFPQPAFRSISSDNLSHATAIHHINTVINYLQVGDKQTLSDVDSLLANFNLKIVIKHK